MDFSVTYIITIEEQFLHTSHASDGILFIDLGGFEHTLS
jgi:hypothetical protein